MHQVGVTDGADGGHDRLGQDLPTEHPLQQGVWLLTAKQIGLDRLEVKEVDQLIN